jgi:hypothetical protein
MLRYTLTVAKSVLRFIYTGFKGEKQIQANLACAFF